MSSDKFHFLFEIETHIFSKDKAITKITKPLLLQKEEVVRVIKLFAENLQQLKGGSLPYG